MSIFLYGKQPRSGISTEILYFGKSANMRRITNVVEGFAKAAARETIQSANTMDDMAQDVMKLIHEYGVPLAETARRLGISTSGVAQILRRGERI